ncbi:MAG: acetate kinase [Kofleriaceae bacterium]
MKGILAVNAGSSSLKVAAFRADSLERIATVELDDLGERGHEAAFAEALPRLGAHEWIAIGHRVVHGRERLGPHVVDGKLRAELEALIPLAPLHQPQCLAGIDAARRLAPDALQVACFDTSFHRTLPDVARRYALPSEYAEIEVYGFHGLSYEFIASVLPDHLGARARGRVIVAHLGSGASMCALRDRSSIATTMGFTPLDGLVMGTRPGALDPGAVLYLIEQRGLTTAQVRELLYHRAGLLGVSGISASMQVLLGSHARGAAEAIELFVYRAQTSIGALAAALGGLDALVFTGGIGEHSATIRDRITAAARWLGDFAVASIATDEELVIARHTSALEHRARTQS